MFETIRNLFTERKQSAASRAIISLGIGRPVWTPVNYESLAKEGYMRNLYVYRCTDYLASACAGIEWNLYRDQRKKSKEIEESPLLDLMRRPNPMQGGHDFWRSVIAYRVLSGNAYIERNGPGKDGLGTPRELFALRPDRMRVVVGDAITPVRGYEYTANGITTPYKAEKIAHWKSFHPLNDWYGMSPIQAAAQTIDQNNESRAWNTALLQNSARPPGGFFSKEPLTDAQFERLRGMVEERYSGSVNAGRPILGEGGIEWQEFGLSPVDMAWIEGLRLSSREICTAIGVPPELVGDGENKTYSNYQEARKAFYEETVLPTMDSLRDMLNAWLTPLFNDRWRLDYNKDDIEALQEDRDKLWMRLEKTTFLTDNEKREAVGYEPYKGEGKEEADKLRKPVQTAPIDAESTFEQSPTNGPDQQQQGKAWDRIVEAKKADLIDRTEGRQLLGFEDSHGT